MTIYPLYPGATVRRCSLDLVQPLRSSAMINTSLDYCQSQNEFYCKQFKITLAILYEIKLLGLMYTHGQRHISCKIGLSAFVTVYCYVQCIGTGSHLFTARKFI